MIKVRVKLFLTLRELVGKDILDIDLPEKSTVQDLLMFIIKKYGRAVSRYLLDERKNSREFLNYLINGKNITDLNGFETPLKTGDLIVIIPPVAGG